MIRKIIIRLFLCCLALMTVAVVSICLAAYLALSQPAFYADLRAQQFTKQDQLAAEKSFQVMERDLKYWHDRSLALQRRQLAMTGDGTPLDESLSAYDLSRDTHAVTVTQKQINAQMASGEALVSGKCPNPRLRMQRDGIWLGFEVTTGAATCVLSVQLKPIATPEGDLRVDLVAARVGRLPLPLKSTLALLPREVHDLGNNLELDLTASTPHIRLDLSGGDAESPSIDSIQCLDSEMTFKFRAPVLKRPQDAQRI